MERVIRALCEELADIKNILRALTPTVTAVAEIYQSLLTREIKNDALRTRWDDFDCLKNVPILGNAISVDRAGSVRVHVAFGFPVTLAYYINGRGATLNSGQVLSVDCGYVFDIPINPADSLNFTVSFDDSQSTTARCKFLRLQEVR